MVPLKKKHAGCSCVMFCGNELRESGFRSEDDPMRSIARSTKVPELESIFLSHRFVALPSAQ